MSRRILFFGNEKLATGISTKNQVFSGLIEAGYDIAALIISQKLNKNSDKLEIVKAARDSGVEVKSYSSLKKSLDEIASFGADAAILAAYGRIIPEELLDIFKIGIINIHPSLLPKHRGPIPIESVILNGETETGASIMRLAREMDAGPIYIQQAVQLVGNETKQQLADKLDDLGKQLLLSCLDSILDGSLIPKDQPSEGATYDQLITKQDGLIDWQENWDNIDRKVRAFSGWPRTRFNIRNLSLALLEAHFENQTGSPGEYINYNGCLAVYCGNGLAVLDQVLPAGSKPMSGKDFVLGYGKQIFN